MVDFEGFSAADFSAFCQDRWASHAFNRQRLEVKLKLGVLGRALLERLDGAAAFDSGLTDERPSVFNQHQVRHLRWFALRPEEERRRLERFFPPSPAEQLSAAGTVDHQRHAQLAVQIDSQGLLCGLFLPGGAAVDRRNTIALVAQPQAAARLEQSLRELPADIVLFDQASPARPAAEVSTGDMAGLAEEGAAETGFVRRLESAAVCLAGSGLGEALAQTLSGLLPLYRLICWSQENDLVGVARKEKQRKMEVVREIRSGDRVRIVGGLAAGKIGIVTDLDRRGGVKVRLGNIFLSLQVDEIERQ